MLVICVFFLCCLRKISSCASSSNATKNDESVAQQPRIRKPKRPNLGTLPQLQWSLCVSVMCHTDQHDQPLSIPGPKYAFFTVCSPDPHVSLRHPSQVSRRYDVLRRRVVQSALQNPDLGTWDEHIKFADWFPVHSFVTFLHHHNQTISTSTINPPSRWPLLVPALVVKICP